MTLSIPSNRRRRARRGITLIELLVVVTIIALFAGVVGMGALKYLDWGKVKAARVQIQSFSDALGAYKLETGNYPTTEQGLKALHTKPEGVENWTQILDTEVPLDPWNHPYVYKYPGEHGDRPDLISYGADGQPGGEANNADIVSWKN